MLSWLSFSGVVGHRARVGASQFGQAFVFGAACLAGSPAVRADVDPLSGIDFVTVGAPGNAPWAGDGTVGDRAVGRGSVAFEYKIGKYEVTSAQWAEFFSAAYDRAAGDALPHLQMPAFWGGVLATPTHPENPDARRWTTTPQTAMRPAGSISWRVAAMYCNWLHNDKRTDRAAFLNGAYDVSTFGYSGTTFTDQLAHHPGAKYFIPTWDQWLKAAHYDPQKVNQDGTRGGWWKYSTSSDDLPYYGPPGVRVRPDHAPGPDPNGPLAMANAGWNTSDFGASPFSVSLGAYSNVTSPWGLYDTAGGTSEWTEEVSYTNGTFPTARRFDGSAWATAQAGLADQIHFSGADFPSLSTFDLGFRIASTVPAPSMATGMVLAALAFHARRRRAVPGRIPCVAP